MLGHLLMFVALNAIGLMNLLAPSELVALSTSYYTSLGHDVHLLPIAVTVLCLMAAPHVYVGSCWGKWLVLLAMTGNILIQGLPCITILTTVQKYEALATFTKSVSIIGAAFLT